jgi:UDP-N-acetyl-D-mannosaminuronic acid transferase (WecB/TagA/CpsF family)
MDHLTIKGVDLSGIRLDIPSEQQLNGLVHAWDDDANHQVSFLRTADYNAARRTDEYASMIASSDLVLSAAPTLSRRAADEAEALTRQGGSLPLRHVAIGARRMAYLEYFGQPADPEDWYQVYQPLKTISLLLSALEQRHGSLFFIGGQRRTLLKAEMNVRATFPGVRIVGKASGDYLAGEELPIMRALQKSTPDIIIAGSLVSDGELWIPRHMQYTRSGIFIYDAEIMEILAGSR